MKFYDINYFYLGTWLFLIFIFLLSISIDKDTNYQLPYRYVHLGVFEKLFFFQKQVGKGIALRTFVFQLGTYLYFFVGVALIVISLFKSEECSINMIKYYFGLLIVFMTALYLYHKSL